MAVLQSTDLNRSGSARRHRRALAGGPCAACFAVHFPAVWAAPATEAAECRTVRLSDIGWTDVTATTAVFSALLQHLGYRPEITVLSVPVTYASMKNTDIDVFLGNWMPSAS